MEKNQSKKPILLISMLIIFITAAIAVLYFQQNAHSPEQTAEKVLTSIAAVTELPDTDPESFAEQCIQQYQPYFTEDALEQALQTRLFTSFASQAKESASTLKLDSLQLERLDSSEEEVSLYAEIHMKQSSPDGVSSIRTWNAAIRLVQDSGRWKIRYMVIRKSTA